MKWKKAVRAFDKLSLREKLNMLRSGIMIPFIIMVIGMAFLMIDYNEEYSNIIDNVAAATEFNSDFRNDMDYKMYRIVAEAVTFDEMDPYTDIRQARVGLENLKENATTQMSVTRIDAILHLLKQLRKTIENIEQGRAVVGREDNMEILDKDIYQFTELIDEKLKDYIRYEAEHAKVVKVDLEKTILNSISYCVAGAVLLLIIVLLLTNRIAKSIENPIQELCDSMRNVAKGNFDIQVQVNPMEEMEVLGNGFNSMVRKIGSLVEDVKGEQVHLRKMELRLLQAQINPHFLYNTLDTIIWLAEDKQHEQVVQMVDQLSIFFRTTLSKGQDFITLAEEESHVTSYLEIQQFRYQDILEYEVDMDPEIHNYYILKICLQPIVENALYHGLKNKRGKGKLTVTGKQKGDYLHFCVKDTGRGMTPEELNVLKKRIQGSDLPESKNGFGLQNVNERLCLNYGEECCLHVNSQFGVGTEVYFKIPVCMNCTGK